MENQSISLLLAAFILIILGASLIVVIADQERAITTTLSTFNETIDVSTVRQGAVADALATYSWDITARTAIGNVYAPNTKDEWKNDYGACAITVTAGELTNLTGTYALVDGTDYNLTTDGYVAFFNSSLAWNATIGSNSTLISYTHCPDDYIAIGWHRSVLFLVPGFFALGILGAGIALFYGVMKKEGIL